MSECEHDWVTSSLYFGRSCSKCEASERTYLERENAALREENARLCPIGDRPVIESLKIELAHVQEQLADARKELVAEKNRANSLQMKCDKLQAKLDYGDYWQKRATDAYESGTCPICFATDEAGHKDGCDLGRLDELEGQMRYKTIQRLTGEE